jgi:hypothetical protein
MSIPEEVDSYLLRVEQRKIWKLREMDHSVRTSSFAWLRRDEKNLLISVRQVLIDRLAHGAERGAARYWATVEAVMLATIPAELCGGQASCTAPPLVALVTIREARIA